MNEYTLNGAAINSSSSDYTQRSPLILICRAMVRPPVSGAYLVRHYAAEVIRGVCLITSQPQKLAHATNRLSLPAVVQAGGYKHARLTGHVTAAAVIATKAHKRARNATVKVASASVTSHAHVWRRNPASYVAVALVQAVPKKYTRDPTPLVARAQISTGYWIKPPTDVRSGARVVARAVVTALSPRHGFVVATRISASAHTTIRAHNRVHLTGHVTATAHIVPDYWVKPPTRVHGANVAVSGVAHIVAKCHWLRKFHGTVLGQATPTVRQHIWRRVPTTVRGYMTVRLNLGIYKRIPWDFAAPTDRVFTVPAVANQFTIPE